MLYDEACDLLCLYSLLQNYIAVLGSVLLQNYIDLFDVFYYKTIMICWLFFLTKL